MVKEKIKVMDYANDYNFAHMWGKLNNVIQAINSLRCQEEEEPIYEVLNPYDCLLISKNEDGILVACSDEKGKVHLERVAYPSENSEHKVVD